MSDLIPERPIIKEKVSDNTKSNTITKSNTEKKGNFEVPDFNELIQFCKKYKENDIEIDQFYRHSLTRRLYKLEYGYDRGGGGWSGAVKFTINILIKMKKRGVL